MTIDETKRYSGRICRRLTAKGGIKITEVITQPTDDSGIMTIEIKAVVDTKLIKK